MIAEISDDAGRKSSNTRKTNAISAAVGKEPVLSESSSESEVIRAFNWYNYSCDNHDAKKYVTSYLLKKHPKAGVPIQKSLAFIQPYEIGSVGWLAKQVLNGNKLPEYYASRLNERLSEILSLAKTRQDREAKTDSKAPTVAPRRNMTAAASFLISEIEGYIDTLDSSEEEDRTKLFDILKSQNPSPISLQEIRTYYEKYKEEINCFLSLKKKTLAQADEQLVEYYGKVSVGKLKKLSKFFDELFEHVEQTKLIKKRMRKPRAKKVKTSTQLTKKLKYKDYDDKYKIKSIQPTDIVGCLQLWVFNTKTRKLGVYHAEDTNPLSVKGSTIVGYNKTTSVQKTLRKPEDVILQIASGSKVQLRHVMSGIKAKSSPMNGRINSETILLRSAK